MNISFMVVDYYSRYVEVEVTRTVPAQIIIALGEIFSRNGLPRSIKTDNDPQFIAEELILAELCS